MTEYRILPQQRRSLLITTVVFFAITIVAGGIAAAANVSGLWLLCIICGPCSVIFLYCYCIYSAAYTRFGPDGISGRGLGLGSRFEYRWEQVGNMAFQEIRAPRGATTRAMTFTTVDGDQIRPAVPVSGGVMNDSEVEARYARIRDAWQTATGRTAQGERVKSRAGWAVLYTLALVIQLFAVIAGVAMQSTGDTQGAPVFGVLFLIVLVAEIGGPLYRGHRRRHRARKGRDRLGLPSL